VVWVVQVCPSLCTRAVGTDSTRLQLVASSRPVSSRRLRRSLHHFSTLVSYPSRRCRHPLAHPIALDTSYSPLWPPGLVSQLHMFVVVIARFAGHCRSRLVRPFRCPARSVYCVSSRFFVSSRGLNWSDGRWSWSSVDGSVGDRNQTY
jgi:hypothetical protein